MFSIQQSIKEHIAYNEGYSKGQEDAHRFYHMMFTGKQEIKELGGEPMNGNLEREILAEWADKGYWLKEYDDHVITLGYKDKEIAAFSQLAVLPEYLRAACQRHEERMAGVAQVAK